MRFFFNFVVKNIISFSYWFNVWLLVLEGCVKENTESFVGEVVNRSGSRNFPAPPLAGQEC